ncbi:MAG: hypothetical protein M3066_09235 [Actinomycetota bacterium]|nr:hypothetical protein [Actinomycetota bacterium]
MGSWVVTVVYALLLAWGVSVGVYQVLWLGYRHPERLLNPLFANRHALRMFAIHTVVVSADLFVIGPLAVAHKSMLWYWGGRIAVLSSSLPLAAYLNRNPQSFGALIGHWVRFRNGFEVALHVAVAAMAVNWFHYYILLWWIVAYRYLDVGPRRLLQRLYHSPAKLAARPWAPTLNWAVIASLYVLTFVAVYNRRIRFATVPADRLGLHLARPSEVATVVVLNLVVAVLAWVTMKGYTDSLLQEAAASGTAPRPGELGAH